MTITQNFQNANRRRTKYWGPEKVIEIQREYGTNLGFSIIGGKIDLGDEAINLNKEENRGVFIKSLFSDPSNDDLRDLKIGDRIIEVNGVNIRHSTCDHAVEVMQKSGNLVRLKIQSLTSLEEPQGIETTNETSNAQEDKATDDDYESKRKSSIPSDSHDTKLQEATTPIQFSSEKDEEVKASESRNGSIKKNYESDDSSESEDERYLEGNIHTKAGVEISRKSAGNVRRTAAEISADPEQEDEFGYTFQKIQKKYRSVNGQVLLEKIDRMTGELGIALAGHKDRTKMAVFICGLNPKGLAYKAGNLKVGDEILEVNGQVLQGRSHLNATTVIKNLPGPILKMVVRRSGSENDEVAVKPITHFPAALDEADRYSQYQGVRVVSMKKGQYGLGIMIVEGKHAEVGQGIFISDIQEGSVAEKGGLEVGDMILGVNSDTLVAATHDQATAIFKRVEGMVTITVCNPNKKKKEEKPIQNEKLEPKQQSTEPSATSVKAASPNKKVQPEQAAISKPSEIAAEPKSPQISAAKPIAIEFSKTKENALGLIICGGSDTSSGGIFILDLYPDGVAAKAQLQTGDQILEFGQENFKDVERAKAETIIGSTSGQVKIQVMRAEPSIAEVEVELHKKPLKGVGLCLMGFKNGKGAYISELVAGGSAIETGKLEIGDAIISIGGQDVQEMNTDDIASLMKASNPVTMKIKRFKAKL